MKNAMLSRFQFATGGGWKEGRAPNCSNRKAANRSSLKHMQKILGLLTNHWLAKLLSLFLAVTLWAVIRSNVKATNSLSRNPYIQIDTTNSSSDSKFDIGNSIHGERKK